jgi:predicted anti-sigma-YlaC factor YlaD
MECSDVRKLISRKLDGEIQKRERELLGQHLDSCEGCREFHESALELYALHREMAELEAPPAILPAVMAAFEEREPVAARRWWLGIPVPAMAVLVMIVGVAIGGFLIDALTPTEVNGQADVLELEYLDEYPPESIGEVLLSDAEGGGDE